MFGKSIFLRNETFERENSSLAFNDSGRFFAVGALRGVPARRGCEKRRRQLERGGDLPLQKNRVDLLTNQIFKFIFSAQVCSLWHF